MLKESFYWVEQLQYQPGELCCVIHFNKESEIFKGHFPHLPIVPGVCMMQIVKELCEIVELKQTKLTSADQLKFLSPINPLITTWVNAKITIELMADGYKVVAELKKDAQSFFKMKAILTIQ